jgi:tRNA-2-methylthio-N6-dimethylallyladenosine synthase
MEKRFFLETYGCQMNFADSEVVSSILLDAGFVPHNDYKSSDLILINTCSIRDHAEQRVLNRLQEFNSLKKKNHEVKIGIIGCMAERLKEELLERQQSVDLVAGPDAYRELPAMLSKVYDGEKSVNTLLSEEETYGEIEPIRLSGNNLSAFISIMRGCQNFCAYCVVPYTRGKERSRDYHTIVAEASKLLGKGYKEVTLLGQNVNSYHFEDVNFAQLLAKTAEISPSLRVRFATSHPKDISDEVIDTIAKYPNICKNIHLPVQSGSNTTLLKMKRKYTVEWYLDRINKIKATIPDCGLSTDIIAGFCGETEKDHQDSLDLMKKVGYDSAFMFKYSERPDTFAAKNYPDDVSEETKLQRLNEIISLQQELSHESNLKDVGKTMEILVEGASKRSEKQYFGRTSSNKVVIFDRTTENIGDYINLKITHCSNITLFGKVES